MKINSFLSDEDYHFIDKIVYKNKKVNILKAKYDDAGNTLSYNNQDIILDREIVEIDGLLMSHTVSDKLPTAVFETERANRRLFVFNYNKESAFLKYHRMVNSVGQMIKEKKKRKILNVNLLNCI